MLTFDVNNKKPTDHNTNIFSYRSNSVIPGLTFFILIN